MAETGGVNRTGSRAKIDGTEQLVCLRCQTCWVSTDTGKYRPGMAMDAQCDPFIEVSPVSAVDGETGTLEQELHPQHSEKNWK